MSNKLITKTALSIAVSSALMAASVNAQTVQTAHSITALNNFSTATFNETEVKEQLPSAHMIVLRATTAADLMAQGIYQIGDSRATIAQIEQVQSEVTIELSSLDFGRNYFMIPLVLGIAYFLVYIYMYFNIYIYIKCRTCRQNAKYVPFSHRV